MASVEDQHAVYNDDDLDDDEDDEETDPPQNEIVVDDDDDDIDVEEDDDDSTSSPPLPPLPPPPPLPFSNHSGADEVTIAVVGDSPKRQRIKEFTVTPAAAVEEKKPVAFDDSRKLFQRLWTDEDEIELLQGFLEYTTQRGGINSSSHHHDTTAFYDQIKSKLQLDFNKNQLVEKLRRLKKKYRNVMSKMGSGKEFVFKSSHDQITFDISCKIWSNSAGGPIVVRRPEDGGGFDDDDSHLNLNIDHSPSFNPCKSRKRPRGEKPVFIQQYYQASGGGAKPILPMPNPAGPQGTIPPPTAGVAIPSLIEETVRSCLSPIFKELLNNVANLNGSRSFGFGMALGPTPLGFGSSDTELDDKWRKQHMLELKVYSRRLELVQDQIKAQLEELRSMSS